MHLPAAFGLVLQQKREEGYAPSPCPYMSAALGRLPQSFGPIVRAGSGGISSAQPKLWFVVTRRARAFAAKYDIFFA